MSKGYNLTPRVFFFFFLVTWLTVSNRANEILRDVVPVRDQSYAKGAFSKTQIDAQAYRKLPTPHIFHIFSQKLSTFAFL